MMKSKRGFTIAELLIVLAVIGVLITGLTFYGGSTVARTKKTNVSTFLQTFGSDMETAYVDYGPLLIDEAWADETKIAQISDYLNKVARDYLHTEFDTTTIRIVPNGFVVNTTDKDSWDTRYSLYYQTAVGVNGNFILASSGLNKKAEPEKYSTGAAGDDVLISVTYKR